VIRRPGRVLAAAGTAAHHGFELRGGVGLVFEPWLGRRGALAAWGVALPLWAVVAAAGGAAMGPGHRPLERERPGRRARPLRDMAMGGAPRGAHSD
jgi:hypothetical protein